MAARHCVPCERDVRSRFEQSLRSKKKQMRIVLAEAGTNSMKQIRIVSASKEKQIPIVIRSRHECRSLFSIKLATIAGGGQILKKRCSN